MDIQEIRDRRNRLSNDIIKLVRTFEDETSVPVHSLEVWHSYDIELEKDVALVRVELMI